LFLYFTNLSTQIVHKIVNSTYWSLQWVTDDQGRPTALGESSNQFPPEKSNVSWKNIKVKYFVILSQNCLRITKFWVWSHFPGEILISSCETDLWPGDHKGAERTSKWSISLFGAKIPLRMTKYWFWTALITHTLNTHGKGDYLKIGSFVKFWL